MGLGSREEDGGLLREGNSKGIGRKKEGVRVGAKNREYMVLIDNKLT